MSDLPIRVIAPPDVALSAVTDAILRRHPHPGEWAPTEAELIDELRIGKQSVRRALETLVASGVVTDKPPGTGGGPRLLQATPTVEIGRLLRLVLIGQTAERSDVIGTRTAIERASVSAAATVAGEADLHDLRNLVSRMREPDLPAPAFAELDAAFHLRIAQSAGDLCGSLLRGLADHVATEMRHAFARVADWPATACRLADEHGHLAALVSAQRHAEAADFVTRHITDFYRYRISRGEREPDVS